MMRSTLESISCPTRLRTEPSEMPSCLAIAVKAARPSFWRMLMMVKSIASSAAGLACGDGPAIAAPCPVGGIAARLTTVIGLLETVIPPLVTCAYRRLRGQLLRKFEAQQVIFTLMRIL